MTLFADVEISRHFESLHRLQTYKGKLCNAHVAVVHDSLVSNNIETEFIEWSDALFCTVADEIYIH